MIFIITSSGVTTNASSSFQLFYYPRDWGRDQGQGGGWGLIHPTDWFLNSYLPGDFRGSRGHDGYKSDSGFVAGGCGLTLCADPLGDGPMPWKYRKSDGGDTWWLGDVDVPVYRYAEAILTYAEAQNGLNTAAVAVQHLNMIRARARKGTGAQTRTEPHDYGTAGEPMDQVSVREAIYMERAWEFAFEAKRWFDLVRRDSEEPNYWATQLHLHDPNSEKLGATSGQTYKKRWPIRQTQITAHPALCPNPRPSVRGSLTHARRSHEASDLLRACRRAGRRLRTHVAAIGEAGTPGRSLRRLRNSEQARRHRSGDVRFSHRGGDTRPADRTALAGPRAGSGGAAASGWDLHAPDPGLAGSARDHRGGRAPPGHRRRPGPRGCHRPDPRWLGTE